MILLSPRSNPGFQMALGCPWRHLKFNKTNLKHGHPHSARQLFSSSASSVVARARRQLGIEETGH
jgi:hypothetical protein